MKNWPFLIGFVVLASILVLLYWPKLQTMLPSPANHPAGETVSVPVPRAIEHPVNKIQVEQVSEKSRLGLDQPLPELHESDSRLKKIFALLFDGQKVTRFFLFDHFIDRFVVMIDNLPRAHLPADKRPVKPTPGEFITSHRGETLVIGPANYRRYDPLVTLLESVDQDDIIAIYVRLYPLFQETYEKMGYPDDYFNDRLIDVIDHLLLAPEKPGPIRVIRPKYYYQFAESDLESLSAGHKIMIRIGPQNANRMKTLLRAYRHKLIGRVAVTVPETDDAPKKK